MRVIPTSTFTGYPGGKRTEFLADQPVDVPADYAEVLRRKGLVEMSKAKAKGAAPDTAD